ncbi:MAG: sugar transferase [Bryobacteraceae bacterium]|jgi:O-antigen biosynthesis protein WbqP
MYRAYVKRVFDTILAVGALLLLWPVMCVVAVAIRVQDGGCSVFRQKRVGRSGNPFTILKFRSMSVTTLDIPSAQAASVDVTPIGRLIRRTNIDELPQILNILRGDMSFVGPRPPLPSQKELLELRRANGALNCAPGLTGLAQIKSFDGMPEREVAEWDGRYARNITFVKDVIIILATLPYLGRRPPRY